MLGYHGTTTRLITARAKLSRGALYVHFSSKAQLLYDIIRRAHVEIRASLEAAYNSADNPEERIINLVEAHVRFHASRVVEARVANHELPSLTSAHRKLILKERAHIEKIFARTIEEGISNGNFRAVDVRLTTYGILSLGIGVARWFKPSGSLSADAVAKEYGDIVRNMLRA